MKLNHKKRSGTRNIYSHKHTHTHSTIIMSLDYTKDRKTTITFDEKQLPGTPPESITTFN